LRRMLLSQKCRDTAGERHSRKETRQERDTAGERRGRRETGHEGDSDTRETTV
jgi:hypothetical protein